LEVILFPDGFGHLPKLVCSMNDIATLTSQFDDIIGYDADRYQGWTLDRIIAALRGSALELLKRGSIAVLIARRELGGLLVAASKLQTSTVSPAVLFRQLAMDYSDGRRHMKLWAYWERVESMLRDRESAARKLGLPFIVPGYRRCLELAGLLRQSRQPDYEPPPKPLKRGPLPRDVDQLVEMVTALETENRLEREEKVRLTVELDLVHDELRDLTFNRKNDDQTTGLIGRFTGWLQRKRRSAPPIPHDQSNTVDVRTGDCLDLIEHEANVYHAIVTDPPYAIGLHGYEWDSDISFSPTLWERFMRVLKPGGYVAFFTASRLYHRAAQAAETAGFSILPFLAWRFREGLPKPINLSELFDRDNLDEREIVGLRRGSGFTQANVEHGAQNRTHTVFAAYTRYVSPEAQQWMGYYYGRNALKPCLEPILLVQKPISTERMIDNIRQWGTGALNIGALNEQYGFWPSTLLTHRKTSKAEHHSDHPSVKPLALMEDMCTLVCPAGGRILDPFAGTGTTGVAAKKRNFDCVLIEQNTAMRRVIEERLRIME
jgi:hypothetical protein